MERQKSAGWALACVAVVFFWQFLTVHYNYGGNWSALFRTGSAPEIAPALAFENIYRVENPEGWDGKIYHYMAHDPLMRGAEAPQLTFRYRRILVPGLAHLLALGKPQFIDSAFRIVILAFFFLGAYWLSELAQMSGHHAAWGLAFILVPSAIVALDRMAVDGALAALCVGFAVYVRPGRNPWVLYAILVAAGLSRDTGLLLVAGYCLALLFEWKIVRALWFGTAAIPTLAWYWLVKQRTDPFDYGGVPARPFSGVLYVLTNPMQYPFSPALNKVITALDLLCAAGVLLGLVLGLRTAWENRRNAVGWATLFFVGVGVFVWRPTDWTQPVDYPRVLSPLLIFLAIPCFVRFRWIDVVPLAAVLPRLGMEMGSQIFRVVKGIVT